MNHRHLSDDEVFVTKWSGTRGAFYAVNKDGNTLKGNYPLTVDNSNYIQLLIKPERRDEFTLRLKSVFAETIHKIVFDDTLANLRGQEQLTVMDVVNDNIRGISAFVHLKREADLEAFAWVLRCNKPFFHIYDIGFNPSQINRFFENEKRRDPNFMPYRIVVAGKEMKECKFIPKHRVCSFDFEVVGKDLSQIPNGAGGSDKLVSAAFVVGAVDQGQENNNNNTFELESEIVFLLRPPSQPADPLINNNNNNNGGKREYRLFDTEKELVLAVCNFFKSELDASYVTGYNILGFDLPFLLNRMIYLGLAKKFYSVREINDMILRRKLPLVCCERFQVIDLLAYLKRMHSDEFDSFSLQNVSQKVLDRGKLDISFRELRDFYNDSSSSFDQSFVNKLCDYVVLDAQLNLEIYLKMETLLKILPLINVCFADCVDFLGSSSSRIIDRFQQVMFPANGICATTFKVSDSEMISTGASGDMFQSKDQKQYKGAISLKAQRRVYVNENISVIDFSSLYPNVIREFNISPNYVIKDFVPSDYSREAVDTFLKRTNKFECYYTLKRKFSKSPLSVLVEYLIVQRKKTTDKYLNYTYKLIANSLYGLLASKGKMRNLECAALVTGYGRQMLMKIKSFIEKELKLEVCYGDTDSSFVLCENGVELLNSVNSYIRDTLKLETLALTLDYEASTTIFVAEKKNYIMKLKSGQLKLVGFCKKLKPVFKRCVTEFLTQLLDLIETCYRERNRFIQKFGELVKRFLSEKMESIQSKDCIFVLNVRPYYEYVNLNSFHSACSYRRNIIQQHQDGGAKSLLQLEDEIYLTYVLPVAPTAPSNKNLKKLKKRDVVEFYDRVCRMQIPVDKVQMLLKVLSCVTTMEKHIFKTDNIFEKYCEQVREQEIKKHIFPVLGSRNVWSLHKDLMSRVTFYYDDLFKSLSEYNFHLWDERDRKIAFSSVLFVGQFGRITHVNGTAFGKQELCNFLNTHRTVRKLNILLVPTSDFFISDGEKLLWFLDLLYARPQQGFNPSLKLHNTPDGRMFYINEYDRIEIFTG